MINPAFLDAIAAELNRYRHAPPSGDKLPDATITYPEVQHFLVMATNETFDKDWPQVCGSLGATLLMGIEIGRRIAHISKELPQ